MIRVGITGGIGSGKSLVCKVFSTLGVPVYYADPAARKLMEQDPEIRKELTSLMGEDIYLGNTLNRPKISGLIFNNPELLTKVNRIVHPKVALDFINWCDSVRLFPYVIHESAVLTENEISRMFDIIILVTAPEKIRFERVITRNGMTSGKIRSIMKNQSRDKEKAARSSRIINNDGKSLVLPQILDIHAELMQAR